MIAVVTTFSDFGFDIYAKNMLLSAIDHLECDIYAYYENKYLDDDRINNIKISDVLKPGTSECVCGHTCNILCRSL